MRDGEVIVRIIMFLMGTAGFAGLFLNWPLILCIILIALGWGVVIFTSTDSIW